jgi:hypothetical protein
MLALTIFYFPILVSKTVFNRNTLRYFGGHHAPAAAAAPAAKEESLVSAFHIGRFERYLPSSSSSFFADLWIFQKCLQLLEVHKKSNLVLTM